jgi:hypothetical protein
VIARVDEESGRGLRQIPRGYGFDDRRATADEQTATLPRRLGTRVGDDRIQHVTVDLDDIACALHV